MTEKDHCRIGSLEICSFSHSWYSADHCRIGSLEIHGSYFSIRS